MSEVLAQLASFFNPTFVLVIWVLVELRRIERRIAKVESDLSYIQGYIAGVRNGKSSVQRRGS